jgi:Arc/MetJ-type ribon-helix-helix transcriptional regulator
MRTISVRLDDASDATLSHLCQTLGLSQTDVVKAGLELLQRQRQSPAALAEALGLVGCFAGTEESDTTGHRGRDHSSLLKRKLHQQHGSNHQGSNPA